MPSPSFRMGTPTVETPSSAPSHTSVWPTSGALLARPRGELEPVQPLPEERRHVREDQRLEEIQAGCRADPAAPGEHGGGEPNPREPARQAPRGRAHFEVGNPREPDQEQRIAEPAVADQQA